MVGYMRLETSLGEEYLGALALVIVVLTGMLAHARTHSSIQLYYTKLVQVLGLFLTHCIVLGGHVVDKTIVPVESCPKLTIGDFTPSVVIPPHVEAPLSL
jgi:hypothetical protein